MLGAALGKKLCLEWRQLKKLLGAGLDKNMLQAALGRNGTLGAAPAKETAGSCVKQKYAWSGVR